jgi:hypothetical protein
VFALAQLRKKKKEKRTRKKNLQHFEVIEGLALTQLLHFDVFRNFLLLEDPLEDLVVFDTLVL